MFEPLYKEQVAEATFFCAICSNEAIVLKLFTLDKEKAGERYADTAGILQRTGFLGFVEGLIKQDIFPDLFEAVKNGDAKNLRKMNSEYTACYCFQCQANYCIKHYRTFIEFDEGFYDCTYGTCPNGHQNIIDD